MAVLIIEATVANGRMISMDIFYLPPAISKELPVYNFVLKFLRCGITISGIVFAAELIILMISITKWNSVFSSAFDHHGCAY